MLLYPVVVLLFLVRSHFEHIHYTGNSKSDLRFEKFKKATCYLSLTKDRTVFITYCMLKFQDSV